MLDAQLYDLTQQVQGAMFAALGTVRSRLKEPLPPPPPLLQIRAGYAESPGWFMVQAAEFDPEPLTVENLRRRDIYASERIVGALLELLAGELWLVRRGESYQLTELGRDILAQMRERSISLLGLLEVPLPDQQLNRLESLLSRLIEAGLTSADQPGVWCLAHSRRRAPGAEATPLQKISQYISDCNAFRDDAHMAAWQPHGLSGQAWEAFAFVSAGTAHSAETVYQQLPFRGYAPAEYQAALDNLVTRQWLRTDAAGHYQVTDAGKAMREQTERLTDEYFYAPWTTLSHSEIVAVKDLLGQLYKGLLNSQ